MYEPFLNMKRCSEPGDLTQPMHDDSVGPVLPIHTLHWVLYETDASQDLGLHNLTMASGEAVHSESMGGGGEGGSPFKLSRTTIDLTYSQQNDSTRAIDASNWAKKDVEIRFKKKKTSRLLKTVQEDCE